jgi:uncharacterized short protein YbdD (DUF466 family)
MTYSNYTARQINPRAYDIPYIGKQATEIQMKLASERLFDLETKMNKLYQTTDQTDRVLRILSASKSNQLVHQNQIKYFDLIKQTRKEFQKIEEQIRNLSSDQRLQKVDDQIERLKISRKILRGEQEGVVGEIATHREDRQRILDHIEDIKDKLDLFLIEQKELSRKHPEKLSMANTQFYALKLKYDRDHDKITNHLANHP